MDRFGAYARILFWGVVLQPDRRLGIDDAYVHDPRNRHHCYRIQRGNLFAKNSDPDETGMGLASDASTHYCWPACSVLQAPPLLDGWQRKR